MKKNPDCAGNLQEFKSCYLELYKPHVEAAAREHGSRRRFMDADSIMVNRVTQFEPGLLAAIDEGRCVPPLYPIGPVLNLGVKDASDDEACVRGSTRSHGRRWCSSASGAWAGSTPRRRARSPRGWSGAATGSCGRCTALPRPARGTRRTPT